MKLLACLISGLLLLSCSSQKTPPYACGPVMDQKGIQQVFQPIIEFMELKPGDVFADVGASSGYYTAMMATLMTNTSFYIQDIDTTCLNEREFNKVIDYYSKQSQKQLRSINSFYMTLGSVEETKLPDGAFDKIYSNATFHLFTEPDKMVQDLYRKLKPNGSLFIRDNFINKTQVVYCTDKKCGQPLTHTDTFLAIMARNKFKLEKRKDFSGYPIYKFTRLNQ
jgi:ubiquinone/menaquinone biosynthesis C-methylase UbiE